MPQRRTIVGRFGERHGPKWNADNGTGQHQKRFLPVGVAPARRQHAHRHHRIRHQQRNRRNLRANDGTCQRHVDQRRTEAGKTTRQPRHERNSNEQGGCTLG